MQQVTVQDVMTHSPITVSSETTIEEVLEALVMYGVPSVYVTTAGNRLVGVVTDYEVLKHQVLGGDGKQSAETLMNRSVPTVRPEECALALCSQFRDGRLARVAVVDEEGRLIGNLSRCDVMRMMLAMQQTKLATSGTADAASGARHDVPRPASSRRGSMARQVPIPVCAEVPSFDAALASR